jgi:alkanesulfonate monooxygenase SsuD/methylene tetrahydromethanopterin reductase-like flavin-dependent oxidoreductase (luciferase family)
VDIGIGLPAGIPGVEGGAITQWAKRAEQAGFSTLAAIDRLVYPNYEPLMALAAAAAVTERIRLATTILIAPFRTNTALFAKQLASLDRLSSGRFVFGVAIGSRDDDYRASGLTMKARGRVLDDQLQEMRRIWAGEQRGYAGAIGPFPAKEGGPELIIGGHDQAAIRRAARFGEGWVMGGGAPHQFKELAKAVDEAWEREGRSGKARKLSLAYFALGPEAREHADSYLHHYYGWLGSWADQIAESAATDEQMVRQYAEAFEQSGCDELIFFPCSGEVDQVELLAQAMK